ncbi:hypothetical protein FOL47_007878 [Perkinsus chesapeaki]|uniref:Amino acid transporter transmembrane domain-containing protein n=1 Tax=Perkinsus chesapeaki TaxID=330153 RepID=A0A7J6LHE6_PERCH|nr:hypothetical protein FOL47_007878 [Perkinsus chesapeaki]
MAEKASRLVDCGESNEGLSVLRAACSITMSVVGIGMLVLPLIAARCGIVTGTCLFIIAAVLTYMGGLILSKSLSMNPNTPATVIPSFEALGFVAFGRPVGLYFALVVHVMLNGICAGLLVLQASISLSLTHVLTWRLWIVIWIAVGIPLSWVKEMKNVGLLAAAGVTSSISLLVIVIVACVQRLVSEGPPGGYVFTTNEPWVIIGSLSTYIFPFVHAMTCPTIMSSMNQPVKYPIALSIATVLLVVLYGSVMILGYLAFGNNLLNYDTIADDIAPTTGRLPVIGWILNIVIIVVVATHYVVLLSPTARVLDNVVSVVVEKWAVSPRLSRFLVLAARSGLVILQGLVGIAFLSVNKLVTFLGALCAVQISIIIPLISYIRLRSLNGSPVGPLQLVMSSFTIIVSLFVVVVAIFMTARQL